MAIDLSKIQFPDSMNIREASLFLDLGEQRIRALVRTNVIKADDTTGRLMFKKTDLEAYKATAVGPRARTEGANGKGFVIHIPADKSAVVTEFLSKQGIKLMPRYNIEAQKRAQAKQKAKKAANKSVTPEAANNAANGVVPVSVKAAPVATEEPKKSGLAGVLGGSKK